MDRVKLALKKALGLSVKCPIWQAMVSRSQTGICEIRVLDEDHSRDLKQNAQFLRCNEKGQIVTLADVQRPAAGAELIVIPASGKSSARIAYWGFRDELLDVSDEQVAIGGGKAQKKPLEIVPDSRTSQRLQQTVERRDPRAFRRSALKRTA